MVSLSLSACRLSSGSPQHLLQGVFSSAQSSLAAGSDALPARWPASPPTVISRAPQTPAAPDPSAAPDPPTKGLRYLQRCPGSSSLARGDAAVSSSLPRWAPTEFLGFSTRRCSGVCSCAGFSLASEFVAAQKLLLLPLC